ncbi:hypothetical protein QBC44DRAFT_358863 [Cladorrhinum sp. PSN332]|nr:hypothetical protein QBC44DRAFT_358863 [Cladorrhinum sp. PSN332]
MDNSVMGNNATIKKPPVYLAPTNVVDIHSLPVYMVKWERLPKLKDPDCVLAISTPEGLLAILKGEGGGGQSGRLFVFHGMPPGFVRALSEAYKIDVDLISAVQQGRDMNQRFISVNHILLAKLKVFCPDLCNRLQRTVDYQWTIFLDVLGRQSPSLSSIQADDIFSLYWQMFHSAELNMDGRDSSMNSWIYRHADRIYRRLSLLSYAAAAQGQHQRPGTPILSKITPSLSAGGTSHSPKKRKMEVWVEAASEGVIEVPHMSLIATPEKQKFGGYDIEETIAGGSVIPVGGREAEYYLGDTASQC